MKKTALMFCLFVMALASSGAQRAQAQGSVSRGPDSSTVRDAELEKESMHNLEVARHYFKLKKAYRAALGRCEEIMAANPNFARMDETLYIAGESSLLLSENKGKQKQANAPVEKLREDARDYLSRLVKEFPDSPFREQAEKDLTALGGPKKEEAESKKQ
jgi:outer membrane protein assembly factor BamD (BamD/ComL family)